MTSACKRATMFDQTDHLSRIQFAGMSLESVRIANKITHKLHMIERIPAEQVGKTEKLSSDMYPVYTMDAQKLSPKRVHIYATMYEDVDSFYEDYIRSAYYGAVMRLAIKFSAKNRQDFIRYLDMVQVKLPVDPINTKYFFNLVHEVGGGEGTDGRQSKVSIESAVGTQTAMRFHRINFLHEARTVFDNNLEEEVKMGLTMQYDDSNSLNVYAVGLNVDYDYSKTSRLHNTNGQLICSTSLQIPSRTRPS